MSDVPHIRRLPPAPWRAVIVLLLAVALMLVSFGHRPLQNDVQATAYILAGGDMADLCGDGGDPHAAADACAACIIAQSVMLPDRTAPCRAADVARALAKPDRASPAPVRIIASVHPARAPPLQDQSRII